MLSFELSAIDLILALSVALLLILYMTKLSGSAKKKDTDQTRAKTTTIEKEMTFPQQQYTKCPRGFGNIKIIGEDNSISERCLGCYMITQCYSENNMYAENTIM